MEEFRLRLGGVEEEIEFSFTETIIFLLVFLFYMFGLGIPLGMVLYAIFM